MKKYFVLLAMPLLVAAVCVFMTACDDSSSGDNKTDCESVGWTILTPANDAIHISDNTNFVIQYKTDLSNIINSQQVILKRDPDYSLDEEIFNTGNSEITIADETATIDMNVSETLSAGATYTSMTISGFRDADENEIDACTTSGYSFATEIKG